MRTEQILLALNIAREHSVKDGADATFISHANASIMLKALEKELGYPLFERTSSGMIPTEKGNEFVKYAVQIERSLQAISLIKVPEKTIGLRICSIQFDFAERAFEKIGKKYSTESYISNMCYRNISSTIEAWQELENRHADVVIAVCRKGLYDSVLRRAAQSNYEVDLIGERHLEVTSKKGHPIIKSGKIAYNLFGTYPAFSSIQATDSQLYAPYFLSKHDIDIHNLIIMDPSPTRYRLLLDTNGFLVSMPIPEEVKTEYGLESVMIKDSAIAIFAAYNKGATNENLIQEYIENCKEFI